MSVSQDWNRSGSHGGFGERLCLAGLLCLLLVSVSGCERDSPESPPTFYEPVGELRVTSHEDLVSAGQGWDGLQGQAPALAEPEQADHEDKRRLAMHANWTAIVDVHGPSPFGDDSLPRIPGQEFHQFIRLDGHSQPTRLLMQFPDSFNSEQPCLVAAPASGSRGVYGAVGLAAKWSLERGCALVMTDKGAGTDHFDLAAGKGMTLDARVAAPDEAVLGFAQDAGEGATLVAMQHAHSQDHPEADWGSFTLAAIDQALTWLEESTPEHDVDRAGVRVIAAGLSNGGGAVLRAAEADQAGLVDAVLAVAPNITVEGAPSLYDYATLAGLYQPCLLADQDALSGMSLAQPGQLAEGRQACETLAEAGWLEAADPAEAAEQLTRAGFTDKALSQSAINAGFGLWRSVAANYASAYLRRGADDMPCGYRTALVDEAGAPRSATAVERHQWWSLSTGIAPDEMIQLLDGEGQPPMAGLGCLRELWIGDSEEADHLRRAVADTRASGALPEIPVLILHGDMDGLVPPAFSSRPYVEAALAAGADRLVYREIPGGQHFDALLALPGMRERHVPLMPYAQSGLERLWQVLDGEEALDSPLVLPGELGNELPEAEQWP
ncbi:hydroxybutyrate-dimer hydrolase [Natronospira proteinivora]|uniref:Hydroxybutyrate-dimer hydrolase n=1 Tax=Natronospira proteinivora TaxID=1807133 RepID=A0ABT1G7E4_9GAMM|nr:D-(-)-3-hydroxybutyrate oligomer hydrolase [Natronospira proteinivora]MCP1727217.1 hydroxybutyrate-dimer hydrolase [Natronospira proteinivora]